MGAGGGKGRERVPGRSALRSLTALAGAVKARRLWYLSASIRLNSKVSAMEIYVNGEPRDIAPATSIAQLLEALDCAGRRVAVEVNQAIVPRSGYAERLVNAGDRIEIVQAIGGG